MSYGNGVNYQSQTGNTTTLQPPANLNSNALVPQQALQGQQAAGSLFGPTGFGTGDPQANAQTWAQPQQPPSPVAPVYQSPQMVANSGISQYAGGTPQGRAGLGQGGMITGIGNAPVANGPGTQPIVPTAISQSAAAPSPFWPIGGGPIAPFTQ